MKSFVFFNDIASVKKGGLDFSLILCNAIYGQCIYFLLVTA